MYSFYNLFWNYAVSINVASKKSLKHYHLVSIYRKIYKLAVGMMVTEFFSKRVNVMYYLNVIKAIRNKLNKGY